MDLPYGLRARTAGGGSVAGVNWNGWRLEVPAGDRRAYRLAQLDDHQHLSRRDFPYSPPFRMTLAARASHAHLPGTWGFGLWNDPFGVALGLGGSAWCLPTLPNAAWFFHACEGNHLSFDDRLPGSGFLVAVFRSPGIPPAFLLPGVLALPFLAVRPLARQIRRSISRIVANDAARLEIDPTAWKRFGLTVETGGTVFTVDGQTVFETPLSPHGRLGLVIWIDNQYAAFRPDGQVSLGRRAHAVPACLDVSDLSFEMG